MDRLPTSLVHCLLLEWLSPESVWTAVRASGLLRRHVLLSSSSTSMPRAEFRAASGEVLTDACVRWFRSHDLVLFTESVDAAYGTVTHFRNGLVHRDGDRPAIIRSDGSALWYQHGKRHRDGDKPAAVYSDNTREWYQHGALHRGGDEPAIVHSFGGREWYQRGNRHRDDDQPAVDWGDGTQEWYRNGVLHRDEDRPAWVKKKWGGVQKWYQNGELHRDEDRPACIAADGCREWYRRGQRHRDGDLPAFIDSNGFRVWYQNGQRLGAMNNPEQAPPRWSFDQPIAQLQRHLRRTRLE